MQNGDHKPDETRAGSSEDQKADTAQVRRDVRHLEQKERRYGLFSDIANIIRMFLG